MYHVEELCLLGWIVGFAGGFALMTALLEMRRNSARKRLGVAAIGLGLLSMGVLVLDSTRRVDNYISTLKAQLAKQPVAQNTAEQK